MFKKKRHKIIKILERTFIVLAVIAITALAVRATDKKLNKNNAGDLDGLNNGCPLDMVYVTTDYGGFCLDKYEASAGPECPYAEPANQRESRLNLDYKDCQVASVPGESPWRNISQDQAASACGRAGKRLASGEEWLQAVHGTPDPEGNWASEDCQLSGNWPTQPGLTGRGKSCVSAAGAYDLIGNVWEWTKDTTDNGMINGKSLPESGYVTGTDGRSYPALTDPAKPNPEYGNDYFWNKNKGIKGIARGGYWNSQGDGGKYSLYIVLEPAQSDVGIGFRCAK